VREVIVLTYHNLTRWRKECIERFGQIDRVPIARSFYEVCSRFYNAADAVLDVGAGMEKPLQKYLGLKSGAYFSLDSEQAGAFDYKTFDDIPGSKTFGLITANQFLEHLSLSEAFDFMRRAFFFLKTEGIIIVGVPNMLHPVRWWQDAMHASIWPYEDLYGMMKECGFEVVGVFKFNKRRLTFNPVKRFIISTVCSTFRMDWCDSILIAGKKPSKTKDACVQDRQ